MRGAPALGARTSKVIGSSWELCAAGLVGVDVSADGTVYAGEVADGSQIVVRLDVAADDPAVAPFEAFRATTGAEEPTWIVGEVTPPDGVAGTGRFVTFVAPDATGSTTIPRTRPTARPPPTSWSTTASCPRSPGW